MTIKEKKRISPKYSFALRVESLQGQGILEHTTLPTMTFNGMQTHSWRVIESLMRRYHCDGYYFDYKIDKVVLYRNVEVIDGSNYKLESRLFRTLIACIYTEEIREN